MLHSKRQLIESVAEDISNALLQQHSVIQAVQLRITKPHVCIDGQFDGMGIEVFRERGSNKV